MQLCGSEEEAESSRATKLIHVRKIHLSLICDELAVYKNKNSEQLDNRNNFQKPQIDTTVVHSV